MMNVKTKNTALIGAAVAILALGTWAEPAHARKHRSGSHERSYRAENFQPFGWFGEPQLKRKRYASRHASYRSQRAYRRQQDTTVFGFASAFSGEQASLTRKERRRAQREALRAQRLQARQERGWHAASPGYAMAAEPRTRRSRHAVRATPQPAGIASGFGSPGLVAEARRYLGGNPTGRSSLWCANFMNLVLQRSGHRTSGSNMARSFASYGRRVGGPQIGAIAVMSRGKRGGHVGVVFGLDRSGNPIVISGNHGGRVAEAVYPRGRIYAYVMPL
jgi:uncharacterized protein (TIGR02594 family)